MPDDALTQEEFFEAWGIAHYGSWGYLTDAAQRVAQAQRRKSLWWVVELLEDTGGFSSPQRIKAFHNVASTLREILGNMGIEPWSQDGNN